MSATKTPQQIQKFEPYTKLHRKERLLFEEIASRISTFLAKDKGEREIIYVPIRENPRKKIVSALEKYYVNETAGWKQFRIMLDRNWIFAVLTKNELF
jgi:hypothetical protein